jgi:hypothetical protein
VEIDAVTFGIKGIVTTTVFGQFKFECKEGNKPSDPRNTNCE